MASAKFPFNNVLVANRGEIALRIIRTLRRLGLRATIVYHATDRDAPATLAADHAIEITGRTPVASYLDAAQIIGAAKSASAGAIHPGYGFLSENADFARAVAKADIVFIGPTPEAIELMGDKVCARNFAAKHGFPVAPSAIEDDDPASFVARARALGAPLLVKPAAGGGGKGMRILRDLSNLEEELVGARSEGMRYFGDGRLYVERYIERPRHIEVQVLGDAHGNLVHVFERECSVQRRFQKIIEETPSPALTPETRQSICETAAAIARAANYHNAGTIEFIFSGKDYYFLEMNTRLQVEHPVTEMITSIDLVEEQIRIAAGERLRFKQSDIKAKGHAIELRLYAEAPARKFAPTTGKVLLLKLPEGEGIRLDCGVAQGQRITSAFDPMLAKLIVHGATRQEAIKRAHNALCDLVLFGCETNAFFLDRILADPMFAAGNIHTDYLDENPALATAPGFDPGELKAILAASALATRAVRDAANAVPKLHAAIGSWTN